MGRSIRISKVDKVTQDKKLLVDDLLIFCLLGLPRLTFPHEGSDFKGAVKVKVPFVLPNGTFTGISESE